MQDGDDSLQIDSRLFILGRTVADTIVVGHCADNLSWDAFAVGSPTKPCGMLYASAASANPDTIYFNTGWESSSTLFGQHIILGNGLETSAGGSFIHLEPVGGQLGLGIRDPVAELDIWADEIVFNRKTASTSAVGNWTVLSIPGANASAFDFKVQHEGTVDGSDVLFRSEVNADGTSPNDAAEYVIFTKTEGSNQPEANFWITTDGGVVINGTGQGRTYDAAFPGQNDIDSTFEVNGSAEFNGNIAFNGVTNFTNTVRANNNVFLGTSTAGTAAALNLVFSNGTSPTTSPANSVALWAADVAGSSELHIRDEAGNVSVLSANVEDYPDSISPSASYPYVEYQANKYAGVETFIAMHRMAELVQQLAHAQGLLPADSLIIQHRAIPRENWQAQQDTMLVRSVRDSLAAVTRGDTLIPRRHVEHPLPTWIEARRVR